MTYRSPPVVTCRVIPSVWLMRSLVTHGRDAHFHVFWRCRKSHKPRKFLRIPESNKPDLTLRRHDGSPDLSVPEEPGTRDLPGKIQTKRSWERGSTPSTGGRE